jgi:hypothetical protein
MTGRVAPIQGEPVSLQVSSLYERGVPLSDREHVFRTTTDDGHFIFTVIPGEHSVTVVTGWHDLGTSRYDSERSERSTRLIWVTWGYGRRPYVLCWCGGRVSRAFITTNRPAHGMLVCHRCAGARYSSQDSFPEARLEERSNGLRVRLRSNSEAYDPIPSKPSRMHWRTYHRIKAELVAVEEELARRREVELESLDIAFGARYPDFQMAMGILGQIDERNRKAGR